jgi:hypothetical protein
MSLFYGCRVVAGVSLLSLVLLFAASGCDAGDVDDGVTVGDDASTESVAQSLAAEGHTPPAPRVLSAVQRSAAIVGSTGFGAALKFSHSSWTRSSTAPSLGVKTATERSSQTRR